MSLDYGRVFSDWEQAIAKKLISEFKRQWACLKSVEFDDLLQDCLFHWLRVRNKFDPAKKASIKTFMAKVIRTQLLYKVRTLNAEKRKIDQLSISLDEPVSDEEGARSLAEEIPDTSPGAVDLVLQNERKERVQKALEKLSPEQREICRLMEERFSVRKIAKILNRDRRFIDRQIERIRKLFKNEGLKD
jgi:RNA polymerase sigma factor (sigma-70 family)